MNIDEFKKEILAISPGVELDGMSAAQLKKMYDKLKKNSEEAPEAQEATKDQTDQADQTDDKKEKPEKEPVPKKPAPKKPVKMREIDVVAAGKSIMTKRGIIGPGKEVFVKDFPSKEAFDSFKGSKKIVKDTVEVK